MNAEEGIGYIDPSVSEKVRTFLMTAQHLVLNEQTAGVIKKLLAAGNDPAMALATLVGKTIDTMESKLGPLTDQEQDQVAVHIAGWMVSSLQRLGMPGLDAEDGRQDLLGRILQAYDQLTQGQPGGGEQEGAAPPQQPPQGPMAQFGGEA